MKELISVSEAWSIISGVMPAAKIASVALKDALGCTLAEPIISNDTIPPFDNSAMDGFAVRAADLSKLPCELPVVAEIPAGTAPILMLKSGECARIMTGAPRPLGADAVVPVEWTEPVSGNNKRIRFLKAPTLGQHVRLAGKDVMPGQIMAPAGEIITPPIIGMLAMLGYSAVKVAIPPKISVVATGDELVDVSEKPGPAQIRNSNGPAIAAQVQSAGGKVVGPFVARDNEADIRSVLVQALEADMIVLSGGVSVGDYDFVKKVLDDMGMEMLFWRVNQRPGKPLAFGLLNGKPVFGLPGNPVSSSVSFEQYVKPGILTALGRNKCKPEVYTATLIDPLRKKKGLHYFTRALVRYDEDQGCYIATLSGPQGSNIFSSMVVANCLLQIPVEKGDLPAGEKVQFSFFDW